MLTSIQIKNFRCFRDLKVEPLKRVNLIAGQNNTGKTALLEAIYLLLNNLSPDDIQKLPNLFRVSPPDVDLTENFWRWLFRDKNIDQDVQIRGGLEGTQAFEIVVCRRGPDNKGYTHVQRKISHGGLHWLILGSQPTSGLKAAVFSTHPGNPVQDAIDYNRVILKRRRKRVEALLKEIEPELEAIEPLQTGNQAPLIYADVKLSEMIPVTQMGQGFCRLLDIYSELMAADANVLLIDEIENGIHHSVLPTVWKGLATATKELGTQVFATTHSLECITAAQEAFRDDSEADFALHRLQYVKGEIQAVTHDRQMVEVALKTNLEIR